MAREADKQLRKSSPKADIVSLRVPLPPVNPPRASSTMVSSEPFEPLPSERSDSLESFTPSDMSDSFESFVKSDMSDSLSTASDTSDPFVSLRSVPSERSESVSLLALDPFGPSDTSVPVPSSPRPPSPRPPSPGPSD